MKKVLFLPLFQMESGHHQTSHALMEAFSEQEPDVICEKIDFLSYVSPALEKNISHFYLKLIKKNPGCYSRFYKKFFSRTSGLIQSFYTSFFMEKMEQLIQQKQPDLIICTHSFPSFLVSKLKKYGVCKAPVVNIYTDFFINSLWGKEGADWHFVPTPQVKEKLISSGISEEKIVISGILSDDRIIRQKKKKRITGKLNILAAGGSHGLGENLDSLTRMEREYPIEYRILCGSNEQLYKNFASLGMPSVRPLSYISCRSSMNQLYDWADAIITKPGGVTVSEALKKRIPVFIHSVLPGQEEINLSYLKEKGLVYHLNENLPFEEQIVNVLNNQPLLFKMHKAMNSYHEDMETESCGEAVEFIMNKIMGKSGVIQEDYIDGLFSKLYGSWE
ncbi:galactosyldiacylglycerol synthase [Metabacillus sp. GX 13764]|uniref:MGDG synthase family glycosyltransferase n=1 Tax=Metabacillus kandeliae TaxID=2900151 RepID=UPI001E315552|nr:galactosyldiacylglycerol synthase [Metabacillus kandeliae]MCD7035598.1 galactosyldiacylglycerol synthase [Metabacillus kandeliae]